MNKQRPRIMISAVVLIGMWLAAMGMGIRVLVSENLVKPSHTYIVEGYRDLRAG